MLTTALVVYFSGISFAPAWLIYDSMLFLLFGLAVVEFFVVRHADTKIFITEFGGLINPLATLLVIFPATNEDTPAILSLFAHDTSIFDVIFRYVWAGVTTVVTWYITLMRTVFLLVVQELDEDDDLGVQKWFSLGEEAWVVGGIVMTFFLPAVAMVMFLLTLLGIFLAKKYVERLEKKSKVPCPTCSQPIHASAIACSFCRHPNPNPFQVGLLGQPKANQRVTDLNAHRLQLIGRKRCPVCATRLKEKRIHQRCPECSIETFANAEQVDIFLATLNEQLPRTLLITFVLGFIPVLGLIPGIIYYRLSLIASLRGYVPRSVGCLTRWGVRIMNLMLMGLQPIVPIGFFVLPLMCLTNFWIYQGIIKHESKKAFGRGQPPSPPRERAVPEPTG
jgi:hypothetical protein